MPDLSAHKSSQRFKPQEGTSGNKAADSHDACFIPRQKLLLVTVTDKQVSNPSYQPVSSLINRSAILHTNSSLINRSATFHTSLSVH